jgi:hypothetical protein
MSKKITFTNLFGFDFYPPKPGIKEIPDWYKNTPEYVEGQSRQILKPGETPSTIKKCMPVFDAISAGYIIHTQVDIQVTQKDGAPYFTWAAQDAMSFHPVSQAPLHPLKNDAPYPKFNASYAIKTEPGYSVLLTQPFHRESVFTIFPGIVDTDTYSSSINFPFVMNDVTWEGMIPAGTPMAQVIPFKRESFKMEIGGEKDLKEISYVMSKLHTKFFNRYKTLFWTRKEYR